MSNIVINPYNFAVVSDIYFEDDFSTDKWTYSGTDMSYDAGNQRMNFSVPAGSTDYAYVNIPSTFGSDDWFLDYTMYITSRTGSGTTVGVKVGGSTEQTSYDNEYLIEWATDVIIYTFLIANEDYVAAPYYAWTTGTNYFVRMSVNASTNETLFNAYPTALDRTNDTNASFSRTLTPATNITTLDFLRIGNTRGGSGFTMNGYLKDFLLSKS